jgi:hypothetical protein
MKSQNKSMLALDQILSDTMREAANEASLADGVISYGAKTTNENGTNKKSDLRRGKWTPEEEAYANRLIEEFKNGMLPIADGTTLRTFLSKLLNCDPMRISKKYVGNNCIGKVRPSSPLSCSKLSLTSLSSSFFSLSHSLTHSKCTDSVIVILKIFHQRSSREAKESSRSLKEIS